jgi:hypothetical protein
MITVREETCHSQHRTCNANYEFLHLSILQAFFWLLRRCETREFREALVLSKRGGLYGLCYFRVLLFAALKPQDQEHSQ